MCRWNCGKLAEALAPLLPPATAKKILDDSFDAAFEAEYMAGMRRKLGLVGACEPEDKELVRAQSAHAKRGHILYELLLLTEWLF